MNAREMAREIAGELPAGACILDVGCGDGYIAHHLGALAGVPAHGIDITPATAAPIPYQPFGGQSLPFAGACFDAVLFCYVLHHAADAAGLLREARRVLRPEGRIIVYEDTPRSWLDDILCRRHERRWLTRSGRCQFRSDTGWLALFAQLGLLVRTRRPLSRLRDLGHPIARTFYVLGAG